MSGHHTEKLSVVYKLPTIFFFPLNGEVTPTRKLNKRRGEFSVIYYPWSKDRGQGERK